LACASCLQRQIENSKNITTSAGIDKSEKERFEMLHDYVKARIVEIHDVETRIEIHNEAVRLDVIQKSPSILVELLFSSEIIAEAKKYRNLFLRFTHNNLKSQKYIRWIKKTKMKRILMRMKTLCLTTRN
jgi:translation initiation factor 5